jgi:mycofactocin precursor
MSDEQSAVLAEETVEIDEITVEDVLVEEVSIDGMCGVY